MKKLVLSFTLFALLAASSAQASPPCSTGCFAEVEATPAFARDWRSHETFGTQASVSVDLFANDVRLAKIRISRCATRYFGREVVATMHLCGDGPQPIWLHYRSLANPSVFIGIVYAAH